jgi:hypothetical protein
MSIAWKIAGQGASITVNIITRESPVMKNVYSGNWLTCEVELAVTPVTGRFKASYTTQAFFKFWTGLNMILSSSKGEAVCGSDEDPLQMTVSIDPTGRGLIKGTTRLHDRSYPTVSFSFESDPSALNKTCKELEAVITQFPIIV